MTVQGENWCSASFALTNGAQAIADIHSRLQQIEARLDALYHKNGHNLDPDELSALQEIDLIVQTIDALSKYIHRISEDIPLCIKIEMGVITKQIPLRDLASRLRGEPPKVQNMQITEFF